MAVKVLNIIGIRKFFRDIVTEIINTYRIDRRFFRLEVCIDNVLRQRR